MKVLIGIIMMIKRCHNLLMQPVKGTIIREKKLQLKKSQMQAEIEDIQIKTLMKFINTNLLR